MRPKEAMEVHILQRRIAYLTDRDARNDLDVYDKHNWQYADVATHEDFLERLAECLAV